MKRGIQGVSGFGVKGIRKVGVSLSDSAAYEARQDVIAMRCCFDCLRTQSAV